MAVLHLRGTIEHFAGDPARAHATLEQAAALLAASNRRLACLAEALAIADRIDLRWRNGLLRALLLLELGVGVVEASPVERLRRALGDPPLLRDTPANATVPDFVEALVRAGSAEAAAQLREALGVFEHLEAVPWAERGRSELRATGERVRARGPATSEELTPQELQVAMLVAEGKTNREVGAQLFLSPKTIEWHLGHVYPKLGIRSRAELARIPLA